jgi:hypothetical protein
MMRDSDGRLVDLLLVKNVSIVGVTLAAVLKKTVLASKLNLPALSRLSLRPHARLRSRPGKRCAKL